MSLARSKIQGNGYLVKDREACLASDASLSLRQNMAMFRLTEKGLSDELLDEILEEVQRECLGISRDVALAHPNNFTKEDLESVISLAPAIRATWSEHVFEHQPEDGHMKTAWRLCQKAVMLYERIEENHYHGRVPPETYLGNEATRALLEFHFHMENNRVSKDGRAYKRAFDRTMRDLASC